MPRTRRPILALTMGDPVGVGAEVVARTVVDPEIRETCQPVVIGNPEILRRAAGWCHIQLQLHEVTDPSQGFDGPDGSVPIFDPARDLSASLLQLPVGKVSEVAGDASVRYVIAAIDLAIASRVDGIVTAPINKEAINAAGHRFAGHTELLASRTGVREAAMMLVTGALRVVHVTTHVAFARVPSLVTPDRLDEVINLFHTTLQALGIHAPRIAVAGLNPHAGEHGLFGNEDADVIAPAVARAASQVIDVSGPWPPDTIFARAARGQFDGVVAMYHDQGHIAVKMLGFDEGVNVSLGLPIVRTSVDHGTAFDIAGQGIARKTSMVEATRLAIQLGRARHR